jgi:hypothetical protein
LRWRAPSTIGGTLYAGSRPTDIGGLLHWWDGGDVSVLKASGGSPVGSYGVAASTLANKVSGGVALTLPTSGANGQQQPTNLRGIPRLVGGEGGIGATLSASYVPLAPFVDLGPQISAPGIALGSDQGRTIHLVWSRPNLRQQAFLTTAVTAAVPLLMLGSTPILTLTGTGTNDTLAFGATVLSATMTKRHTHSVSMRWAANGGVDIWLDDTQVATGVTNTLSTGLTGTLKVLGGDGSGTAGCFFHELAIWDHALSTGDMAILLGNATSVSKRWARGTRKMINLIGIGQSNAEYFQADAEIQFEEAVRYHLGALGVNLLIGSNRWPSSAGNIGTVFGGIPLYDTNGGLYLTDPGTGASPTTWAIGNAGTTVNSYIAAMASDYGEDIVGAWFYYSEADSTRNYTEKATYAAAVERYASIFRAATGKPAAQVPFIGISALPFGGGVWPTATPAPGVEMVREAISDISSDAAQNFWVTLPNTTAVFGRGAAPDGSGGDNGHVDVADNVRHAQLAGPTVARALIASGAADAGVALPAGIPTLGGPHIVSAQRQTASTILITVAHDAGTDIKLPGNAAIGAGWTVQDGFASINSPGSSIAVSSVARVSATTVQLTLATPMTNSAANCRVFYPWGSQKIGRGSALTDNYSTVTKPAGYDIGADLGTSWANDCPLAVPPYGVALS